MSEEIYWQAVVARDMALDGAFFFGVMTTGVYCRPSCAARLPLRKNVRFYQLPEMAERDGLRACLRCRPLASVGRDPAAAMVEKVCRYLEEHADEAVPLDRLAKIAGLSAFHLQRSFKAITGVSPKIYQANARLKLLKTELRAGSTVTQAQYAAGYGSSSRMYEKVDTQLGMTPLQYRKGGDGVEISYAFAQTCMGLLMMAATDRGICFIQFADTRRALEEMLAQEYPAATRVPMTSPPSDAFHSWISALSDHLAGKLPHLELPLDVRGTAFQLKVWRYLQSIPYGAVQSYSEAANGIGQPRAVRAVATACARNVAGILIPCHRIIRSTGELGGYRWGVERKRALIDQERTHSASAK
jgi:AraC family transcriptional regulator, regulatory protein of adaptative response / methylated-DNA-[protein]-cysteine methyltransferase